VPFMELPSRLPWGSSREWDAPMDGTQLGQAASPLEHVIICEWRDGTGAALLEVRVDDGMRVLVQPLLDGEPGQRAGMPIARTAARVTAPVRSDAEGAVPAALSQCAFLSRLCLCHERCDTGRRGTDSGNSTSVRELGGR